MTSAGGGAAHGGQDRLAEIKSHHQQYLDAEAATTEWEALGVTRSVVGPPYPPLPAWYGDDVGWLVGEVERLRGLLGRLEWAGTNQYGEAYCPVCIETEPGPHEPDCELAAEIATTPHA